MNACIYRDTDIYYMIYSIYKIFILGYIYHRTFQGYVFLRKPDTTKSLKRRNKVN